MEIQFWAATDVGRVREHNEDNFLVDKRLNLFVVCDGMGGHSAGEVASAVAVRAIREVVANNREILERCQVDSANPRLRKDFLKLLEYAVQEACTRIFDMAQQNAERRGMGTTCSMLAILGRRFFIGHVGDSRIYLCRNGQVHQLTEDHTLVNEMIRRGRVKDPKVVASKYKNAITRAVGVYESVEVDTLDFDALPGDRFLVCSDGLSGYFEEVEGLTRFLAPKDPTRPATQEELKRITHELVEHANGRGGKDNITAVLVALSEDAESPETEDARLTMETIRTIPLFHYLTYKELARVVNVTQRRDAQEGERVIAEGEDGEELYVIMRGDFVVERAGREVARLGAGGHFGEMALIDDGPRSATVVCAEDGVLLTIHRKDFYDLLREDPTLAVKLLWNFIQTFSGRLRDVPLVAPRPRRFRDVATGSTRIPPSLVTQEAETLDELAPLLNSDKDRAATWTPPARPRVEPQALPEVRARAEAATEPARRRHHNPAEPVLGPERPQTDPAARPFKGSPDEP
jgi:serine/threonine protein phosphatase PrpC